jgi:gliding motility-associated protein GldM
MISGPITKVEGFGGIGKLKIPAGGPGVRQFGGVIKIKNAEGVEEAYPFNSEYVVGTPSATISPTKMNVFYIGVDNPVSISVPGASNEQVTASITGGGGTITRAAGNGMWTVKVTTPTQECMVNVAAKMGASSRSMGSMKFRVKRVPDPVAYVGGVKGGQISKGTLIAAGGIIPKMDNFDFDLYFQITSFTLSMNKKGDYVSEPTSGSKYSAKMITMLNGANRGQKVYFEDIKAKGPDGTTRNLGSIALKIN